MRAQWACSRERRIALYKRSSIKSKIFYVQIKTYQREWTLTTTLSFLIPGCIRVVSSVRTRALWFKPVNHCLCIIHFAVLESYHCIKYLVLSGCLQFFIFIVVWWHRYVQVWSTCIYSSTKPCKYAWTHTFFMHRHTISLSLSDTHTLLSNSAPASHHIVAVCASNSPPNDVWTTYSFHCYLCAISARKENTKGEEEKDCNPRHVKKQIPYHQSSRRPK